MADKEVSPVPFEFLGVNSKGVFDPQNPVGWATMPEGPGLDAMEQMEEATAPGLDLNLVC